MTTLFLNYLSKYGVSVYAAAIWSMMFRCALLNWEHTLIPGYLLQKRAVHKHTCLKPRQHFRSKSLKLGVIQTPSLVKFSNANFRKIILQFTIMLIPLICGILSLVVGQKKEKGLFSKGEDEGDSEGGLNFHSMSKTLSYGTSVLSRSIRCPLKQWIWSFSVPHSTAHQELQVAYDFV